MGFHLFYLRMLLLVDNKPDSGYSTTTVISSSIKECAICHPEKTLPRLSLLALLPRKDLFCFWATASIAEPMNV